VISAFAHERPVGIQTRPQRPATRKKSPTPASRRVPPGRRASKTAK
jgi:hypothetical protein